MNINVWQAEALAAFLKDNDRPERRDDNLRTAHAVLVRLDECTKRPAEDGYVLGVCTKDGNWAAFWGDGSDVTDEYPQPDTIRS